MSILDSILAATDTTRIRIISEVHDTNKVNVEIPNFDGDAERQIDSISSGTWDVREYGISRETAIAQVRAAQTPEARERVISELKARALRRASLDTSNGRVNAAFALKAPWHGLGTVVSGTMTSKEAISLAGLDWNVAKKQLYFYQGESARDADGAFGMVRQDTGAYLGTVGSRYAPVQNAEGFEFLDSVIGEYGARYESAGSIYGGKSVWMLAHMPQHTFAINGDTIEPYVVFTNCHDGSGAAWCFPTTVRVECANTFRTASREKGKGLSIRHAGNIKGKIILAREALGLAVAGFAEFKEQAATLVEKKVDAKTFADSVLDQILDLTRDEINQGVGAVAEKTGLEGDEAYRYLQHRVERRGEILDDIMNRYESERCHPRGTAWAAFNAITEHADHNTVGRQSSDTQTRLSRRFESVLAGDRDEMKQMAFATAMAL